MAKKEENTKPIPEPNYDGSRTFIVDEKDEEGKLYKKEIAVVGDFIRENIVQAYLLTHYTQQQLDELRAVSYKKKKTKTDEEELKELDAFKDVINEAINKEYGKDF